MTDKLHNRLSRRERQIMDILYRDGKATAAEVQERLPESPSYSAVRALLRILEEKGFVRHEENGQRYVFRPKVPRETAKKSALRHMLNTFFSGSPEQAMTALLDESASRMSDQELERLQRLIEQARQNGGRPS
jgi:BlaI family penicillinase repressor